MQKAVEESDGDFDKAEALRISGAAKAAKRGAERTASTASSLPWTTPWWKFCATDFVAKGEEFKRSQALAQAAFDAQVADRDAFWRSPSTPVPPSRRRWPTWPV